MPVVFRDDIDGVGAGPVGAAFVEVRDPGGVVNDFTVVFIANLAEIRFAVAQLSDVPVGDVDDAAAETVGGGAAGTAVVEAIV